MEYVTIIPIVIAVLVIVLRQVNQYEKGVMFLMGRFTGIKEPGWRLVIPVFQRMVKVDMRVNVIDVPDQDAITKDNVSIRVNAVVYYKVKDARAAVIEILNYVYAISQLAQTTMRDIVGEVELDELLINRDQISKRIKSIVDEATDPWGISIVSVELKHIELPEDLKRTISKQAEAERERRAVIIKSRGEVSAAENMAKAARMLAETPGALHLRSLQSLNDISSDHSNTIVFAVPVEVLRAFDAYNKNKKERNT
ncbi:slipin family protein [Patescibacteria group bacterium]